MGVYLGSTDLLSSAGGSSRFYTNVYEVPKMFAAEGNLMVPYGSSPQYSNAYNFNVMVTGGAGTPNANFPRYYGAVATNDTYVTICNITSATNGGVFWDLIGPGSATAGDIITVKITKDGEDAVEQAFTVVDAGDKLTMGHMYLASMGSKSSAHDNTYQLLNNYYSGYNYTPDAQEGNVKSQSLAGPVSGSGTLYMTVPSLAEYMVHGTGLYFKESFKLEVKSSNVSTTSYRDKVAALVTKL